jgi:hypothetical protein
MKFPGIMTREFLILACTALLVLYLLFDMLASWMSWGSLIVASSTTTTTVLVFIIIIAIAMKPTVLGKLQYALC